MTSLIRSGRPLMSQFAIRIPKVSTAAYEATVIAFLVDDGGTVHDGDALFFVETDKVETEVPAGATGVVRWTAEVGATYPVGAVIGLIDSGD